VPPYLKTAEPKPMLRPPDLVSLGEEGVVLNQHPGGAWSVRFTKGAYLMDNQYIEVVPQPSSHTALPE
jgi:Protein of unknown function (DUF3148)